jgi:hypothetical protein
MGILNWLLGADSHADDRHARWIGEAVDRIVTLNPRLRLARRYQVRLEPAAATALQYVIDLVGSLPAPREASAAAWASDPWIHAFFASADEVARTFSRSAELRALFDEDADLLEAYAVLGMAMSERHVLGVAQDGDAVRRDVPQTIVNFSEHHVGMCGCSEHDLKVEIVRRMLDQLALEGLARVAGDKSRRELLERERALLRTRLQLLEHRGAGIRSMLGSDAALRPAELARLQAQVEENQRNLADLGVQSDALDRELERVREVLADPARHLYVTSKRLRLNRMNVVQEGNGDQDAGEIEVHLAQIPGNPPQVRAFTVLRFTRADLLPATSMVEDAARLLQ